MSTLLAPVALAALLASPQFVSSHAPSTASAPAPSAPQPARTGAPTAGGLTWQLPKTWKEQPSTSAMRVSTYFAPAAAGDTEGAEVAVFYFGQGQGGSVDSNVQRWLGQVAPEKGKAHPASKITKVGAIKVTLVTAEGTYAAGSAMGGPSTSKPGFVLYGAIAEGPQGPVFFKMTGPKKTMAAAKAGLDELVASLK